MFKKFLCSILLLGASTLCFAAPKILVLGDSLAAGYGIDIQQGWVALLQKKLYDQYEVINAGISGDTTSNGLARLPKMLNLYHPKIVIVELGGNDGLRGIPIPVVRGNLEKIIKLAKVKAEKVVLIGVRLPPNYGPAYTQQFQTMYSELAKKYQLVMVPLLLAGIDENAALMQADRIHPTAAAQQRIFENVWGVLKKYIH